jgi:hypothetical protein
MSRIPSDGGGGRLEQRHGEPADDHSHEHGLPIGLGRKLRIEPHPYVYMIPLLFTALATVKSKI